MSDTGPKSIPPSDGGGKVPAKIGRYEILEKVGSGRTGTVYRASDPLIGRVLAIKTFRVDLTPGPLRDRFLQRFYHEARISGGLSHPNIVALFDVGEEDGLPFLVFEHIEGPTLDVAIAKAGRLDSAETIRVVEQTAAALDFAHSRGIVHRDIRPANIILANDKRVRIADFGIARVEGSQLTQHGEVLGTPAYMSPEQIRGQELSAESDLFSLAVCAYEMLSGSRPFAGKTQSELLEALVNSPPTEPKELRTLGIPSRDFMFVFERALAKDPSHRFADAASFARALKSCLGVVAPGDEPMPVTRIALPDPPPATRRSILPPVAPPPPQKYAPAKSSASRPDVPVPIPSAPTAADASADATFITSAPDASAPPSSDPSADATFISPPPGAAGSESSARPSTDPDSSTDDDEVSPTLGFDSGLNAKQIAAAVEAASASASADATMISPQDVELPPTHRMSRAAVESVLSKSAPSQAAPPAPLQKTLPGSEKAPVHEAGVLDDLLPPTREMPKLPEGAVRASTPSPSDPSRTASSPGGLNRNADKTIIMTEAEKAAAAKLRDRSVAKLQTNSQMQKSASSIPPPPPPTRTMVQPRPPAALPPPVRVAPAPARSSMLPKILILASILLAFLALLLAVFFWTRTSASSQQQVEKWNDLPVYPEAEVDKSPLLFSHEIPKPNVEKAVSVTVSWIVTPEGVVDDPKIVTSGTKEIDAYVMEAVKKWRYEPGQKGGKTVPVRVLRKYTFKPLVADDGK